MPTPPPTKSWGGWISAGGGSPDTGERRLRSRANSLRRGSRLLDLVEEALRVHHQTKGDPLRRAAPGGRQNPVDRGEHPALAKRFGHAIGLADVALELKLDQTVEGDRHRGLTL